MLSILIFQINNKPFIHSGKPAIERQISTEEFYGCLTGGMGYTPAITWTLTGRVERVHNWATAKSISRRYPKK